MKMRGRRRQARTVCDCCNGPVIHTRASEKREAGLEIQTERQRPNPDETLMQEIGRHGL